MSRLIAVVAILGVAQAFKLEREPVSQTAANLHGMDQYTASFTEQDDFKKEVEQAKMDSVKYQAQKEIDDAKKQKAESLAAKVTVEGRLMEDGLIHAQNG